MHFSLQLPTHRLEPEGEFASGEAVAEMARAAERAGFDAVFVTDHPFPTDRWLAGGGHHAFDPFVALSFAAAATTRLRLQTHVLVLPYRNPFVVAKAAASLDVLSGGRLVLGVAAGYMKGEFRALGADFEHRNERADEGIRAIHRAWTEDGVVFGGAGFEARGNTMRPRPLQRPHPPIWVGGNSRAAIHRAVELADGWVPFPNTEALSPFQRTATIGDLPALRERLDHARAHAERIGRASPLEVCFAPLVEPGPEDGADERFLEHVRDLDELGVNWLAVEVPGRDREAWCEAALRMGDEVLARAASAA